MRKNMFLFFLLGTVVMIYVMGRTGAPLKTAGSPNGILNLEFAYDTDRVNTIIGNWASIQPTDTIAAAKLNTWLDFIFLFFYAGFLYLASAYCAKFFGGSFGKAGKWIGRGALVAGVMDMLENSGMLLSLSGHISGPVALFTVICSTIKWTLAITAAFYVLMGGVALARVKLINR